MLQGKKQADMKVLALEASSHIWVSDRKVWYLLPDQIQLFNFILVTFLCSEDNFEGVFLASSLFCGFVYKYLCLFS